MQCLYTQRTLLQCCLMFIIPLLIVIVQTDEVIYDQNDDESLLRGDNAKNEFLINEHKWRAIDEVGSEHGVEDLTVPYDANHSEITVTQGERYDQPKRRRMVRKRKRRPFAQPADYDDTDERPLKPRRLPLREQEHYLDDHWQGAAFAAEQLTHKRPYHKRRRQNPVYEEDDAFEQPMTRNGNDDTVDEPSTKDNHDENATYDLANDEPVREHEIKTNSNTDEKVSFKRKSYRKPYGAHKNNEDNEESESGPNLKALLKQSGGSLSLVEVLQQKNLSLAEFLKGKDKAISLLKNPPLLERVDNNEKDEPEPASDKQVYHNFHGESETSSLGEVYNQDKENNKFSNSLNRRLPPARLPKLRTEEVPIRNVRKEQAAMKEQMNAQRKRLSSLRSEKDNRIFSEVKHFDVITEATTEKRIFVPSKYNNDNDSPTSTSRFQPSVSRFMPTPLPTQAEELITTTTSATPSSTTMRVNPDLIIKGNGLAVTRNRLALKPRLKIPIFENINANTKPPQLTTTQKQTEIKTEIPQSAFAIDIKEIAGINKFINQLHSADSEKEEPKPNVGINSFVKSFRPVESEKDEPLRISMNINEMLNKSEETTQKINNLIPNVNDYTENVIPNYTPTYEHKSPSAKDEIMEILKDNNIRVRLAKVLALRNMTFAELVALRERGSSQVHLADIFHSQSKEPNPVEDDTIEIKNEPNKLLPQPSTTFESFPNFRINPSSKESKADNSDSLYTPLIKITPPKSSTINREARNHKFLKINSPDYATVIDILNQQNGESSPQWTANIHSDISYLTDNLANPLRNYQKMLKHEERIEAIEDTITAADTTQGNYNYADKHIFEDEDEYMQLPSGVRSAIVASFAIIASSIFIFMTIFIIFKWQQKKRRRLRYSSSINTIKGRLPILQQSKRKNGGKDINPIMVNVTSNSKNVLFNAESQNADSQEYLWDSLRKPFH